MLYSLVKLLFYWCVIFYNNTSGTFHIIYLKVNIHVMIKRMSSLDFLIVYQSNTEKKRVGRDKDGGYIISTGLDYDCLISCGVDKDISFELDFLKEYKNIPCFAFDGTIQNFPEGGEAIQFIKKNIAPYNSETTTNLHDLIDKYSNIFLKIDIESYEYRWLNTLSLDQLNKFKQIVIEFHYPFTEASFVHFDAPLPVEQKMDIIKKMTNTHTLVHFHANNCCGTTTYNTITVPNIFECTYVRNDIQNREKINDIPIPSHIDMPNINGPDIFLSGYPFTS